VTLQGETFGNLALPELTNNVAQGGGGGGGGEGLGVQGDGGHGGNGGQGDGGGVSSHFSGTVLIKDGQIAYNRAYGGVGGLGGDYNGGNGLSNFGYGGGVWAYSYTDGGKDEETGNMLIDLNVADVNPDVDGKLIHI
jgi:hypothetical protein